MARYIVGVFRDGSLVLPIGNAVEVKAGEQLEFLDALVGSLDATYQQHMKDHPERFAAAEGSHIAFDFADAWNM